MTQVSKHRDLLWQAAAKPTDLRQRFKSGKLFHLLLPTAFGELGDKSCSPQIQGCVLEEIPWHRDKL